MHKTDWIERYKVLMAQAENLQSIAGLARVHDHLYRYRSYTDPHWKSCFDNYRELSDRIVIEIQKRNIQLRMEKNANT